MALILCPECGLSISDKAVSCPHCGYPLSTNSSMDSHDKSEEECAGDSCVEQEQYGNNETMTGDSITGTQVNEPIDEVSKNKEQSQYKYNYKPRRSSNKTCCWIAALIILFVAIVFTAIVSLICFGGYKFVRYIKSQPSLEFYNDSVDYDDSDFFDYEDSLDNDDFFDEIDEYEDMEDELTDEDDDIDVDIDDVVEDVVDAVVSNALRNGKNAVGTKRNIRTNRNTSYGIVQSKSVPDSTDFSDKIDNPGIAVTTDSSYIKH